MNYYKNTLSPIADAASFFREKKNTIVYEENAPQQLKRSEPTRLRTPLTSLPVSARKLKMEHH